jgi:IS4 transposase
VVVYDPDNALVCDIVACEDAYESERVAAAELIGSAQPGQAWIGDRHFCTEALLRGLQQRGAGFIVREHAKHPRLQVPGAWSKQVSVETGRVREQSIALAASEDQAAPLPSWRRIELELDRPNDSGDTHIGLWSNLPEGIDAATIARLYRKRWRIEGMFGRLESVMNGEIKTLGHPRAALLGFAVAVLAYNVLALLKAVTEQAHRAAHPQLDVSTYHLAVEISSMYESMAVIVPPEHWPRADDDPQRLLQRLLRLAAGLNPKQLATSKRGPKNTCANVGYVSDSIARSHVSTARIIREAGRRR